MVLEILDKHFQSLGCRTRCNSLCLDIHSAWITTTVATIYSIDEYGQLEIQLFPTLLSSKHGPSHNSFFFNLADPTSLSKIEDIVLKHLNKLK